ncbi:MAG: M1 family aminopeptidase [Thermoanaerobaculia bacterium]
MRTTLCALAVLLLAISSFGADPPPVAALAEVITNPTLGETAAVQNVKLVLSERMTVTFASGSAAVVKAGDTQIGLFFSGKGTLEYRTSDADEAPNVRFNTRKASDFKLTEADGVQVITTDFERMYLRSAGIELPKLTSGAASLDAAFKEFREDLGRQLTTPATHLLIKQRIDSPGLPVAVAEFAGGKQPALYILDTVDTKSEGLYALNRQHSIPIRELVRHYWPSPISDAPVGRARRAFSEPSYLLTHIDYTLVGDEKENGALTITETIMPRVAAQRVFRFDLYSTTYDTNYKPRKFNVRKVTDAAGKELSFHHENGSIVVGLPAPVPANQTANLTFTIDGDFLYRPNADATWQLGVEPWFPQPDLNGQYYTVHSLVKVKKPFVAFTPGKTIRSGEEGDYNVVETKIERPVQFAIAHGGRYFVDTQVYDDGALTIRVASYGKNNPRAMKQLNNLAYKLIKFYEPWLGPFPFPEFNIIEINSLGFGQAPPGTMFITKEAFNPTMGDDNKLFSQGINHRFAHEIAHQYWGHVAKMGSEEEQWITESFAEYSSALAIKQLKGKSAYDSMVATWRANAKDATEVSSIALANRIRLKDDGYMQMVYRTHLVYDKGAYLLGVLHKQLGDDKFLTFLRSLQGIFGWRYVTTGDVAALLQRVDGGKDYRPFFDQYFYGTKMPEMPK